jgi:transcriptional regulator with XRE-family HTH domain
MGASERTVHRATVRALGTVRSIGTELREARIGAALSQQRVADAAGISRARYAVIETGSARTLRLIEVAQAAAVVGLDLVARLYPGAEPLRDAGQARPCPVEWWEMSEPS